MSLIISRTSLFRTLDVIRQLRSFADHARSREPLLPPVPKNRIKSPSRGGRNLRNRYLVLEKSLRGKQAFTRDRNDQQETTATNASAMPLASSLGSTKVPTFKGFIVPTEPSPPESDECCMSGCAVCVYDLYEESLDAYKESVGALRKNLVAQHIPEHEWPAHIQTKSGVNTQPEKRTNVVMNAFEEMERRLKEKHGAEEAEASGTTPPSS